MHKIAIYILLALVYLGLSKSFSPREKGTLFISDERVFSDLFSGTPLSVILVGQQQNGFLIPTYYHKYKIVYGFRRPRQIIVRTSRRFYEKNLNNLGLSLFRRKERTGEESNIPLPAGALFLGDPAYGTWVMHNSGNKVWSFHRAYKHFSSVFGWDGFLPTYSFYEKLLFHQQQGLPFYGPKGEFGTNGEITKINLPKQNYAIGPNLKTASEFFESYFKTTSQWIN